MVGKSKSKKMIYTNTLLSYKLLKSMNPHQSQISAYHQVQKIIKINISRAVKSSTKIIRLGDTAITPDPGWGRLEDPMAVLEDSVAVENSVAVLDPVVTIRPVGSMKSLYSSASKGIQIYT